MFSSPRNSLVTALFAAGVGAALMFFLDPDHGRRRRALLKGRRVDDAVLTERVRAALGYVVLDVNSIDVKVRDGCVVLKGPVSPDEMEEIVACTERVRGVRKIENRLSPNAAQVATH